MLRTRGIVEIVPLAPLNVSKTAVGALFTLMGALLCSRLSMAGLRALSGPERKIKFYAVNPDYMENDGYEDFNERFS